MKMIGTLAALLLASQPLEAAPEVPAAQVAPVATAAKELLIHPGETVVFRMDGKKLVELHRGASAPPTGPGDIRAEMSSGGRQTMLTISTNGPGWIAYRAKMRVPGGRLMSTSVCTIMDGNKPTFESWPHPVTELIIYDFRPARTGEMHCE
jgi:hypothetical protein